MSQGGGDGGCDPDAVRSLVLPHQLSSHLLALLGTLCAHSHNMVSVKGRVLNTSNPRNIDGDIP
jgi:hypothetical protein